MFQSRKNKYVLLAFSQYMSKHIIQIYIYRRTTVESTVGGRYSVRRIVLYCTVRRDITINNTQYVEIITFIVFIFSKITFFFDTEVSS